MDIRYKIINRDGKTIFCNLSPGEVSELISASYISNKTADGKYRHGKISTQGGQVLAISSNIEHIKSSKKFKKTIEVIANSIDFLNEIIQKSNESTNKNTNRLLHNLTSLNAHNIQEIYSLIPQDEVSKKMGGEIAYVESIINENPKETAKLLLKIAKNNAAMKAEFSVFKKLFDSNPTLQKREHNVHKVLMNVFYLFFPDFTDKEVEVIVGSDKTKYIGLFDYESFHVALYHLIENAAKYIKPKTRFKVEIKNVNTRCEISFDMISLEIKPNEKEYIFEEGVSGDLAKQTGKAGDGIGMNRAKKILELNSGEISLLSFPDTIQIHMGIRYQRNIFTIMIPKKL